MDEERKTGVLRPRPFASLLLGAKLLGRIPSRTMFICEVLSVLLASGAIAQPDSCAQATLLAQPSRDGILMQSFGEAQSDYDTGADAVALSFYEAWYDRAIAVGLYPDEHSIEGLIRYGELTAAAGAPSRALCLFQAAVRVARTATITTPDLISNGAEALLRAAQIRPTLESAEGNARALLGSLEQIPGYSPRTLAEQKADVWGTLAYVLAAAGHLSSAQQILKTYDAEIQPKDQSNTILALARASYFAKSGDAARAVHVLVSALESQSRAGAGWRIPRRQVMLARYAVDLLVQLRLCAETEQIIATYGRNYSVGPFGGERVRLTQQLLHCVVETGDASSVTRIAARLLSLAQEEINDRLARGQMYHLGTSSFHYRQAAGEVLKALASRTRDSSSSNDELLFAAMQLFHFNSTTWSIAFLKRLQEETRPEEAARLRNLLRAESVLLRFNSAHQSLPGTARLRRNSPTQDEFDEIMMDWVRHQDAAGSTGPPRANDQLLPTLRELRARLRSTDALMTIAEHRGEVWVSLTRPNAFSLRKLAVSSEELRRQVMKVRAGVGEQTSSVAFDTSAAVALFDAVFRPFDAELQGATRILWVPDGSLKLVPPTLFVTDTVAPTSTLRSVHWLARRYAFITLPTPLAATLSPPAPHSFVRGSYLGVGDPTIIGRQRSLRLDHTEWRGKRTLGDFEDLPPLPDSAQEVEQIAAMFTGRATTLIGDNATEARLRSLDLGQYQIIHFATHALGAGDLVGLDEPALVLSSVHEPLRAMDDGLLNASEIGLLAFNADWVILSACNTASPGNAFELPGQEPLSGFARAFFLAGARSVVVSNWPVNSAASAQLITTMARRWNSGSDQASALKQAMESLIDDPVHPEWSQPRYWAPFSLVTITAP